MPLLEQVLEQFPNDVKIIFKHFPLRNHALAQPAAQASLAAAKQGRFWEYHDRLFAAYNQLSQEKLKAIAADLELDLARFESDSSSPEVLQQIREDMQQAQRAGVRGTPAIYVDGRPLESRSLQGFQNMVQEALERRRGGK